LTGTSAPDNCYLKALRFLSRQDYTSQAMAGKLQKCGFSNTDIESAVNRLIESGYINDRQYAERIVTTARNSGRFAGYRLYQELRRRGLPADLIDELLQENPVDEVRELENARYLIQRRYAGFDPHTADERERRRVAGFLQRRGYAFDCISKVIDKFYCSAE